MGMAVGGNQKGVDVRAQYRPSDRRAARADLIFMVITPRTPTGLKTLVPQPPPPNQKQEQPDDKTIVVSVLPGGKLMINQDSTTWNDLGSIGSSISLRNGQTRSRSSRATITSSLRTLPEPSTSCAARGSITSVSSPLKSKRGNNKGEECSASPTLYFSWPYLRPRSLREPDATSFAHETS